MDSVECTQCICKDAVAHVIMPTSKTDDNSFHLSFLLLQTLDRTAQKIPVDKENSPPVPHTGDNQTVSTSVQNDVEWPESSTDTETDDTTTDPDWEMESCDLG